MSWFTDEMKRISDYEPELYEKWLTANGERVMVPKRDFMKMMGWLKQLGRPSMYDDPETCKNVVDFYEHGTASGFEKAFINCYDIADDVHKNRLALAFPDFAQARNDFMRGTR